jgi:hypothetical protein
MLIAARAGRCGTRPARPAFVDCKESDMKQSGKVVVLLALLATLCSGGSCRSDVAQSAATSFFDTLAEAMADALATRFPANNP